MAKSVTVADLAEQMRNLALESRGTIELLKQLAKEFDEQKALNEKHREDISSLRQENALLRQRLDDHLKRVELWDNRRWGLIVLMAGALLSLASGLIVTLARK